MRGRIVPLSLLVAACGAPTPPDAPPPRPSRPVVTFPEAASLEAAVTSTPTPDLAPLLPEGEVTVERWTIRESPAPGDPVYEPDGAFEPVLDAAIAARGVSVTRSASLRCVATEMARFYTAHEGLPTDRLTRYLLASCGSSAVGVGRAGTLGTTSPRASDRSIVAEAGDDIREQIAPVLVDGGRVGLGVHRQGSRVAVMLVVAAPKIELAPPAPPEADGLAVLRGRLRVEADAVFGLINQGDYGVARCRVTPGFVLPELELRCPMLPGDDRALVQINTLTLGRVLTEHAGTVLVRRDPDAPPEPFAPEPVGQSTVVDDPAHMELVLHQRLNLVRVAAGLPEIVLSNDQSAVAQRVAPHLLASILRAERSDQDVLALGLLAGWRVRGGTIRWGDVIGQVVLGSHDVADWLSDTLEQPGGRWVLMRPDIDRVALGAVPVAEPEALGMVVSTYAFYERGDHRRDAAQVLERILRERANRRLPPPQTMDGLDALWTHARQVSLGREPASVALQRGLDEESRARHRPLRGYLLETIDVELGDLPQPILTEREISVGVAVGHTRAEGAAWGQYAVFIVFGAT